MAVSFLVRTWRNYVKSVPGASRCRARQQLACELLELQLTPSVQYTSAAAGDASSHDAIPKQREELVLHQDFTVSTRNLALQEAKRI